MSRIAAARMLAGRRALAVAPRARLLSAASPIALRSSSASPALALASSSSRLAPSRAFHASRPAPVFHFTLHDIGEGITEVEIIRWDVKVGDRIDAFDNLCEVQSDKSVVEITSPHAGVITKVNAEPGSVVKVGQTLCEIDMGDGAEGGEPAPEPEAAAPPPPPPAPAAAAPPPPPPAPAAPAAAPAPANGEPAKRKGRPHPLADAETAVRFEGEASILPAAPLARGEVPDFVEARRAGGADGAKRIVKASPAVRALAHRLGVDLTTVKPTGPSNRVVKEDVEGALAAAEAPAAAPAASPRAAAPKAAAPRAAALSADRGQETERMEMGRTRKVMYRAMGSQGDVPHFGYVHSLDLTNLLPLMKAANAKEVASKNYVASDIPTSLINAAPLPERTKTSVLPFLVKALSLALEEHPIMRARVKENADGDRWLEVARDAAIGIAVSDPKMGLLTPSLPPVHPTAPVSAINDALATLRASPAKPGPAPNITLSSVGPLGEARSAMPVLPPGGGVAIAAIGRAAWEMEWALRDGAGQSVWTLDPESVAKGGPKAVLRCTVGWSGDHRVLEGAELISFTETWKRYVEEPWRWLEV
ncbi:lipoamide acyltransferase family protein [Vanrija pseudolonga]|uniref:Dihydrolipoamide acetyltransferase component of pyruvate dehydrogenase complex n=1 Tax=Vanrija pseudolonga TaxID=143232 RepID=A0AAF0YIA9_9TREE|nr:Lipoamide acyltransferase component of branched-chain alpha-keto acid dehydrogenase complex, mitochondrial [Vanrija pseudolonga]